MPRHNKQPKTKTYLDNQYQRLGLSAPPERWERVGRYQRRESQAYKKWYQQYSAKVKETLGITPEQALARNQYGVKFDQNGNMIIKNGKPVYIRGGMARIPQKPDVFNAVQQELYYYDRKQAAKKKAEQAYQQKVEEGYKKILESKSLLAREQSEAIKAKERSQRTLLGAAQGPALFVKFREAVKRRKDKSMYRKNKTILGGIDRLNDEETLE